MLRLSPIKTAALQYNNEDNAYQNIGYYRSKYDYKPVRFFYRLCEWTGGAYDGRQAALCRGLATAAAANADASAAAASSAVWC